MALVLLRPVSSHLSAIALDESESKTVGRGAGADVIVDEPSLSRLHARLRVANGTLHVEDLGSTNGVFVNGVERSAASLDPSDRVRFGSVEYIVASGSELQPLGESVVERAVTRVPIAREVAVHADQVTLEALLTMSRDLMAFTDLPALLERVLDRLQATLNPHRAAILLADAATGALTPRAVRPRGAYTSVSEFASSTIVREAIESRSILLVEDITQQPRLQDAASLVDADVRSVICVPLLGRTGPIGALYADRIGFGNRFAPDVAPIAGAFAAHAAAALETASLYEDRERHFRATLEAFARAIDARDAYTAGHSERVTAYTIELARASGLPDAEIETIRRAGMLHDIGKVGVPDAVLLKPGALDAAERAAMEAHVLLGCRMLEGLSFLVDALPAVRGHHERWDGRGYPDGLSGDAIHIHARLMAVADSYDAMTSARPYRDPITREEAVTRIRQGSGSQFDPRVVDTFTDIERDFQALREATLRIESV